MPARPGARPRAASTTPRRVLALTLAATTLAAMAGCGSPDLDDSAAASGITRVEPADRKAAPAVKGDDLYGQPRALESYRGKVVVLNIWGSWCPPCRKEQPVLSKLAREMKPAGVEFLGIAIREGAPTSRAYVEANDVPYPSISDSGGQQLVGFTSSLPAVAVPTTYVIDREGRVATRLLDVATEPTLRALIDDVVNESG